jgi:DNA-binding NtrC family response regulator
VDGSSDARFYLLVVQGGSSSMFHLPQTGVVEIGRALDADLVVQDGAASRRHAKIMTNDGIARVIDLGSYNGTYVNGERVEGSRPIASGDVISIGEVTLILHGSRKQPAGHPVLDPMQLRQRLEEELERATRYQRPLSVVALGWRAAMRAEMAAIVADQVRLSDLVGWGGETQLIVVLPEVDADVGNTTARMLVEVASVKAQESKAGLASCPSDGCDADTLLASARAALTAAKPGQLLTAADTARTIQLGERSVVVADPAMSRLFALIERLAQSDLPILILGETGSGKENAAYGVHVGSPRAKGPFVVINCAAIPETLVESELFGHDKGAFSGATSAKPGKLEAASNGTVFLDEIGELPLAVQAKLLRALENKKITRLGEVREREVDVRFVAATNRNLEQEVKAGKFRQDLFFRLGAATVVLPPLRDRPREIPLLARTFLEQACTRLTRDPMTLSPSAMQRLAGYNWPGNVRELRNVMEYLAAAVQTDVIEPWDLPGQLGDVAAAESEQAPVDSGAERRKSFKPIADEVRDLERKRMQEALEAAGGVQRRAAELIGMPLRTFVMKLKQYGLR